MNCDKCNKELRDNDVFCPKCGVKIQRNSGENNINLNTYGSFNTNIGNGVGNSIDIENINICASDNSNKIIKYEKDVFRFGMKEKTIKKISIGTIILSIISFVSSIITITESGLFSKSNFGIFSIVGSLLFVIFIFIRMFIKKLSEQEFIYIKLFWWLPSISFILDENRIIRKIKIKGKCNICNGNIRLYRDEETYDIIGVCKRNNNHRFNFDHTNFTGKNF